MSDVIPPLRPILVVAVALLLLAGCAGGQQAQTAPSAVPSALGSPTTDADPRPSTTATPRPSTEAPSPQGPVEIVTETVATGLEAPWDVVFTPDDRTVVTERDSGRLLEIRRDGTVAAVREFDVDPTGEGGLLGLAVSPDYADDQLLYAYLTTAEDNRIVRFRPGEPAEVVISDIPSAAIHNGGRIAFGPDGMLYAGTGEAGQPGLAQDRDSLGGKILRVTPDGDVPDDNPFAGSPVWTLGHRNVQGLDWDADGRLWASEFGPDRDDEINLIEPGNNYGWPVVTGRSDRAEFTDPQVVRQPPDASWSGMTLPRDPTVRQWDGDLLIASLRGERLWRIPLDDGVAGQPSALLSDQYGRLRATVSAPDGSVWILTSNRDGRGSPAPEDDRIVRLTAD